MAEIGIAASVIGIVGFGLDLSKKLYQFAATTSAAGEEVSYVAKNVTNYADALELLAERLDEDDEPIYSKHTIKVVARLHDQSCDLFDKIEELIPEPKYGREELNFSQKIAWNFKKGKVEFLAGQIECLKTTASLVATVLFAGKKIKSKRSSRRYKHRKSADKTNLDQVKQRVSIAVFEQQQALNKLPELQERAVTEAGLALQAAEDGSSEISMVKEVEQKNLVSLNDVNYSLKLHKIVELDNAEKNAVILQENNDLLLHLLERLTTLNVEEEKSLTSRSGLGTQWQGKTEVGDRKGTQSQKQDGFSDDSDLDGITGPARSNKAYRPDDPLPAPAWEPNRSSLSRVSGQKSPTAFPSSGRSSMPQGFSSRDKRSHPSKLDPVKHQQDSRKIYLRKSKPCANQSYHTHCDARKPGTTKSQIISPDIDDDDLEYLRSRISGSLVEDTPLSKIDSLRNEFLEEWMPLCQTFVSSPPPDSQFRAAVYRRLSEGVMTNIIEAADRIEMQGDDIARSKRKILLSKAQEILEGVDRVMTYV